jgi:PAS domain-containing protein
MVMKSIHTIRRFLGAIRLHPEDAEVVRAAIQRHLKERVAYQVEYRLQAESGEYLWFLARGRAIWDSGGRAIRMSGSIQDITERKQAELDLKTALSAGAAAQTAPGDSGW